MENPLSDHADPIADQSRAAVLQGTRHPGWLLAVSGVLVIFAGILANLRIYFAPTSLFNTFVILILLVGGLGLIARAVLREYPSTRS